MKNKEQTNACYGCFGAANGDCDECTLRIGVIRIKNKEKYSKEIVDIACNGNIIAVVRSTGELRPCCEISCGECLFNTGTSPCREEIRKWAESEYIEKPVIVISKRDRAFLDCLKDKWKYMARDDISSAVYVFSEIPKKSKGGYLTYTGEVRRSSTDFNIDFPMVKWSDSEPWLIEDLKKLEVVDSYE